MAANIYQTVGFYFAVGFQNLGIDSLDAAFQSVGGLEVQLETESIKEGKNQSTTNQQRACFT